MYEKCLVELINETRFFFQTTFDSLNDIYDVTYFSDKTTKQNIYDSFIDEINGYLNHQVIIVITCIDEIIILF